MDSFFEFAWEYLPTLLYGTRYTLLICISGVVGGFFFGWILALGRAYGNRVLWALSAGYIELFRGTPMLIQMFIIYYGLPIVGIVLSPLTAVIWAIGLNSAAYQAEYFRGGIGAVRSGQVTAARALGMSRKRSILHVVLPQAMRISLPQWTNEVILELKYTSIAYVIGVHELMGQAYMIGTFTFEYLKVFLLAAFIYVVLVAIVTTVFSWIERRYALRQ